MNGPVTPLAVATLGQWRATQLVFLLLIAILLVGGLLLFSRNLLMKKLPDEQKESASSIVRSWLAITLVIGLLVFVAVAFVLDDKDTRNVLVGALAANVGTAIAFYFSSKASGEARKDILDATFGTERVPLVKGLSVDAAKHSLGTTSFVLDVIPPSAEVQAAAKELVVDTQKPEAHTMARRGTTVVVTMQPKAAAATTDLLQEQGQPQEQPQDGQ